MTMRNESADRQRYPSRRKPASGVRISLHKPTIVYVTICAANRRPWIAQPSVHDLLVQIWQKAAAWLVGYYLLMPDHVHFFCAPRDGDFQLDTWMRYWKRGFTMAADNREWVWQDHHWDRRLRHAESYQQKWQYVRENPMRKGLVASLDDWPYQGMLNVLRW